MGSELSCFNNSRQVTLSESQLERSVTDDEKTEFLANANSIFLEEILSGKEKSTGHSENRLIKHNKVITNVKTEPVPNRISILPPPCSTLDNLSPEKSTQSSPSLIKNRIFSSNISLKSVNIIETLNKSTSACSSNFNSRSNSRCVSPLIKGRFALID